MYERGDRGADEQRRRRHSDDGLPLLGSPGGDGALQMVEGAVTGFEALDSAPQQTAQGDLVQVRTEVVEVAGAAGTTGAATGTPARSCTRAHARYRAEEGRQAGEPFRFGAVVSPALRLRHSLDGHGVRIRVPVRVHVRRVLRPVVHNSVSSPVDLTLVRTFLRGVLVLAPTHA